VRDRLDLAFDDLGEQQVKNITRPVRTYGVVLGASSRAARPVGAPLPLPDKPSLAVLLFENMTRDAEQEYFVDGMVEEITTAIARLPWLYLRSWGNRPGRSTDTQAAPAAAGPQPIWFSGSPTRTCA
jgi:adenylate cyclase